MINYILLGISFISLYIAIIWISFLYFMEDEKKVKLTKYPSVTVAVPVHNEQDCIAQTLNTLLALDYPKNKLKIIVVNDASTDNTQKIVEEYILKFPQIILINRKKGGMGKAYVVNEALDNTTTEYFACVDADSYVNPDALKIIIEHFSDDNIAAVISTVKVASPKNFYEKFQHLEYIVSNQVRKLMSSIDTLAMTHGVLSVFRTKIIKQLGGFDNKDLSEDFEIGMRLKCNGYRVVLASKAYAYTKVPMTFKSLWRQRIRWYRGFVDTHIKYKKMFFSKEHGTMGFFQMPMNMIGVVALLVGMSFIIYESFKTTIEFIGRSIMIDGYFQKHFFNLPTLKDYFLSLDFNLMLPIYLSLIIGILLFYLAHKYSDEDIKNPFTIAAYFILVPYLSFIHWLSSILEKVIGVKRKW